MEIVVDSENNKRIDAYLSSKLEYSRSKIEKMLEDGLILIDGKKIKRSYVPKAGDIIAVTEPEVKQMNVEAENIPLDIVYEDEDVIIVNKGNGNIYGLYGKNSWNNVFIDDYSSSKNLIGTISLANMGDGLSIGIYGENSYNYSYDKFNQGNKIVGTVKIHNLGDGVAIGMYGNGGTVENSGDIIITRTDFTDDNLTDDDTSDDTTYSAKTEKGGTAIGIYGASGTTIKNSGTITIDGAEKAYGIWAEDSTVKVYNHGTITIDGTSCTGSNCKNNAIVLNGGKCNSMRTVVK